ncbi:NfeD family protein [Xanthomonas albilineans]|uniref:Putative membrane protein implicated in regulation of membrane protease activity n=1 Tax=Xanthomonas albilineans (strain GPE PC73 / CFBP 7063) TaxID=380358 RepID=D2UEU3_XANAP|nr:NfeD family protein [Xanthomonas albilineans]QHQ28933.1 putative membrane protein [Xanthomonas albilineans]CBA16689.1 putative membrane protein implicated in regulation of membrane protease activity [Xanthomonas albilineans GPE PC73]
MRLECMAWGALTLLLFGVEALVPGAFMLWMGLAAAVVFLAVLVVPGMPLLLQIGAFVVLSFAAMQVYRTWFRARGRGSDRPLLNRRAEQLIGRWVTLDQPIQGGRGRAKVDDAFWVVGGPDLPAGSAVRIVGVDGMTLLVRAE